ncbi:MAG: DUF5691 domain-containing protein [Terracidiphilus sp.]
MGERMNARELKGRVLPVLLSGTRRETIPPELANLRADDPRSALHALSLTGQALRFERPSAPAQFAVERWPRDERAIVPEAMRTVVLRLLEGSKCTEDTALALAWALEKRKLRPHPFDLPKMDGFVRRHAAFLGVAAQFWAQRDVPAERRSDYFDADVVSEQNWTDAPLGRRTKFLEVLRGRDSNAGRELLESAWGAENAEARLRLLSALEAGLSSGDQLFLERIAKDRAPRVRSLAHRFLARLDPARSENPALAACMERILKTKTGLLKKRDAFKLELPATVKEPAANRWIQEQFADVGFDELARALEVSGQALVEAAESDEHLLFALSLVVSREKRFDLMEKTFAALPDAWCRMSESSFDDVSFQLDEERTRWIETIVRPRMWMPQAPFPASSWLLRRVEGQLPAPVMEQVLASKWWLERLENKKRPESEVVQVFCALCPAGLRDRLRAQIEPLEMERKEKGLLLLEILDGLEKMG